MKVCLRWGFGVGGLQNDPDSIFDIQEEVVDQALDVVCTVRRWECTQPNGQ